MAEYKLSLEPRTLTGKKLKSLRAEDKIPAVIYGDKDMAPILVASDYTATEKVLNAAGYHSPITLEIKGGEKTLAIAKMVDLDPVTRRILNVEFRAISSDSVVEATTPIEIVNYEGSEASKLHLAYLQVMDEIEVKAKPTDLPEKLEIDASALASADDRLTIADLKLPKGVELVDKELEPTTVIASIYDPAAEAAAREAADKAAEEAEGEATEETTAEDAESTEAKE